MIWCIYVQLILFICAQTFTHKKKNAKKFALWVIVPNLRDQWSLWVAFFSFHCGSRLVSLSWVGNCESSKNLQFVFIYMYRVSCHIFLYHGQNQREKRSVAYLKKFEVTKPVCTACTTFVSAFFFFLRQSLHVSVVTLLLGLASKDFIAVTFE